MSTNRSNGVSLSQDTTLLQENLQLQQSLQQTIKDNVTLKLQLEKDTDPLSYQQYKLNSLKNVVTDNQRLGIGEVLKEQNQVGEQKLQNENSYLKQQLNRRQQANPYSDNLDPSLTNIRETLKQTQQQNHYYQDKLDLIITKQPTHSVFDEIQKNALAQKQQHIIQLELKLQSLELHNKQLITQLVEEQNQDHKKKKLKKSKEYLQHFDPKTEQKDEKPNKKIQQQMHQIQQEVEQQQTVLKNQQIKHEELTKKLQFAEDENDFLRENLQIRLRRINELEKELSEFGIRSHEHLKIQIHGIKYKQPKEFEREQMENHKLESFLREELKAKERKQIEIDLFNIKINEHNKQLLKENIHLKKLLEQISLTKTDIKVLDSDQQAELLINQEKEALFYKQLYLKEQDTNNLYRQNLGEAKIEITDLEYNLVQMQRKLDNSSKQTDTEDSLLMVKIKELQRKLEKTQRISDQSLSISQMKLQRMVQENFKLNNELSKHVVISKDTIDQNDILKKQQFNNIVVKNLEQDNILLRQKLSEYINQSESINNSSKNHDESIKIQKKNMEQIQDQNQQKTDKMREDLQTFVHKLLEMDHENQNLRKEIFQLKQSQIQIEDVKPATQQDLGNLSKTISDWTFKMQRYGGYFDA